MPPSFFTVPVVSVYTVPGSAPGTVLVDPPDPIGPPGCAELVFVVADVDGSVVVVGDGVVVGGVKAGELC